MAGISMTYKGKVLVEVRSLTLDVLGRKKFVSQDVQKKHPFANQFAIWLGLQNDLGEENLFNVIDVSNFFIFKCIIERVL